MADRDGAGAVTGSAVNFIEKGKAAPLGARRAPDSTGGGGRDRCEGCGAGVCIPHAHSDMVQLTHSAANSGRFSR